ncbi:phosphate acyltransferase PlsX [Piscinibacterium candidicorallinum]|jgi:glycerol-3-phosphate acyltransferase PlsX
MASLMPATPAEQRSASIAVDCMGGDHGPSITVPACISFARAHPNDRLILVGRREAIEPLLAVAGSALPNISVHHASQVVEMDDPVEVALRKKRDSSIRVAATLVKEGEAAACVSAGNTGALMAISRYVLKTLPGIDRPAIATAMPNVLGRGTVVLDLGANAQCEPEHLLQFAVMGSALATALTDEERPRIGLLNIGEEVIKGNDVVKRAGELLRASELNFIGNVEGNDIFRGVADVVVCDGFTGNVALKSTEGVAQMIKAIIAEEFGRGLISKALKLVAAPVLLRVRSRVDHRRYNGAALLGLNGVVIKSHGSMDAFGFEKALEKAHEAVTHRMLEQITRTLEPLRSVLHATAGSEAPVEETMQ